MDTLEFLRRVLPDSGYYCAALPGNSGGFKQRFFADLGDLSDFVQLVSAEGVDSYYAVSSYKEAGSRKGVNVESIKLIALDLDVGKVSNSYATRQDALSALAEFLGKVPLPAPMVVASGAGFHVYWVLTRALTPAEWLPIASAVKQTAMDHGLIIDPAVPADVARILRPVGTTHQKTGRKVKVIMDAEPAEPEAISIAVAGRLIPQRKSSVTLLDKLAVKQDFPPAVAGVVASKCQQIGSALFKPQNVPEPLWYAMMGVAAFTTEPEATALAWSSGHPLFSQKDTLAKLEQWRQNTTGPATCKAFENANPGGCKGCPFLERVASPVRLGAQFEEVEAPAEAVAATVEVIPLPMPFKRTVAGIKMRVDDVDLDICPFDIYPTGYGKDDSLGYEVARYQWNRPHVGWCELKMRQALLTEGHKDFPTVIADQGIVLQTKKQTEYFQMMLRTYMDSLRQRQTLTNHYGAMGWKSNFKEFVLGDTTLRREDDGTVTSHQATLASGIARSGSNLYTTAGNQTEWTDMTNMLEVAGMPWHMFALGLGWAAPLFAFTGLKGMSVSLYGPTGGGKTLIQYWVQSIYGDPDKLHFAAKYTQNSLFTRLGLYQNLPMTIDEATMMPDKDVGDFLYWVSQGSDKARLTRSAEERELKTWATPVLLSTNKSIAAKLLASGLDSDAQMARLLEVNIPVHKLFVQGSDVGRDIYTHLMSNYGHAGRVFISHLLSLGEAGVRQLISDGQARFRNTYNANFVGSERFWEQAIVLQDIGSRLAAELGLIKYNPARGTAWVISQLNGVRESVTENKLDCYDMLSEFLNDNASSVLTVMHTPRTTPYVDQSRIPRGDIRARFELYRNAMADPFVRGTLHVDRSFFRQWLTSKGGDYKFFQTEMTKDGSMVNSGKRVYLGRDTPVRITQSIAMSFDLTHPRLAGILNEAGEAALALPLTVVGKKEKA